MTIGDPLPYLYIFAQSNLLEVPVYYAFYRGRMSLLQVLLLVTLCNAITHPIVFFGFMAAKQSYLVSILLAELFAITAEAPLHRRFGRQLAWERTWGASLIANLVSWQVAPALTYLLFLS